MIAPQTRPSRETLIKSTKFLAKPSRKPLINFGKPSRSLIILKGVLKKCPHLTEDQLLKEMGFPKNWAKITRYKK